MRRAIKPFAVEFKNSRRASKLFRTPVKTTSEFGDLPVDDVPVRDIREDLRDLPDDSNEAAMRAADAVFGSRPEPVAPAPQPVEPEPQPFAALDITDDDIPLFLRRSMPRPKTQEAPAPATVRKEPMLDGKPVFSTPTSPATNEAAPETEDDRPKGRVLVNLLAPVVLDPLAQRLKEAEERSRNRGRRKAKIEQQVPTDAGSVDLFSTTAPVPTIPEPLVEIPADEIATEIEQSVAADMVEPVAEVAPLPETIKPKRARKAKTVTVETPSPALAPVVVEPVVVTKPKAKKPKKTPRTNVLEPGVVEEAEAMIRAALPALAEPPLNVPARRPYFKLRGQIVLRHQRPRRR